MGTTEDPKDGPAVAAAVFGAVAVYGVSLPRPTFVSGGIKANKHILQAFLVFCASQAWLHMRESRRGAISLR
jgi:hypothetical protein